MNSLPIESSDWLADFKNRVALERSTLETLIQWGLTESASDIHRVLEESFSEALNLPAGSVGSCLFRLSRQEKMQIADALRAVYLKTRDIPRRRGCQERLHSGLLTGFEELTQQLVRGYEDYLRGKMETKVSQRAA